MESNKSASGWGHRGDIWKQTLVLKVDHKISTTLKQNMLLFAVFMIVCIILRMHVGFTSYNTYCKDQLFK